MPVTPAAAVVAHALAALLAAESVQPLGITSGAAPPPPVPFARPAPLPAAVAVIPGFLLHGSGHFAAGDRKTAYTLLALEGVGLATLLAGATVLGVTGASRRTVGPVVWTMAGGAALFTTSWAADLYGVFAPARGTGAPLRVLPLLEARVGSRYVRDPTLAGRAFLGPAADVRFGSWRLSPATWFAVDGANHSRYELFAAYRVFGPRPTATLPPPGDGSFLELVAGGFHHRYREQLAAPLAAAFQITSFELRLEGRMDLARVAPSLYGSFVEGGIGVGLGAYHYSTPSTTEAQEALLARFAFGLQMGRRADRWGEARIFYDHHHDDFPGGFKTPGLGSGALGHVGVDARAFFSQHWGVRGEVAAGAAVMAGLSVVYRYGKVSL